MGRHLLGRDRFQGFWPPEMGFCMEMIPMLKRHGYRYVLVDSWYIKPKRQMRWEEVRYHPYLARHGGEEMVIVPREAGGSTAPSTVWSRSTISWTPPWPSSNNSKKER